MKKLMKMALGAVCLASCVARADVPRVIIDTDLGSSLDDILAIDFATRMHKAGEIELIGLMMDRPDRSDPEKKGQFLRFADGFMTALGLPDLPIGRANKSLENVFVFTPYWTLIDQRDPVLGRPFLPASGRTVEDLTDAVSLYRRLLSESPDKSVEICQIGLFGNLMGLLDSTADQYSPLSGKELVRQKVKTLRVMAGGFELDQNGDPVPVQGGHGEFNVWGDQASARRVFSDWPTDIVCSPWEVGLAVYYPPEDMDKDFHYGCTDRILEQYNHHWHEPAATDEFPNRTWDVMTIAGLVRPDWLPVSERGKVSLSNNGKGFTLFTKDETGNCRYQLKPDETAAATLLANIRSVLSNGRSSCDWKGIDVDRLTCLVDLHLHLDGAISLANAKELIALQPEITTYTTDDGQVLPVPKTDEELERALSVGEDCPDLTSYLTHFALPSALLQTSTALTLATKNICLELKAAGHAYAEIRFAPQKHMQKGMSMRDATDAVLAGIRESGFDARVILCSMRSYSEDAAVLNMKTVNLAVETADRGVVAVDLAGAEALFTTEAFEQLFAVARRKGLHITIHAGEAAGPESVELALDFGAERIGHGVRARESDLTMKRAIREGVTFEFCPKSNLDTKIFKSIVDYPLMDFLYAGAKVTINTDNPGISSTTIRQEWHRLIDAFDLMPQEMYCLLQNSVNAAFCDEATKAVVKRKIDEEFAAILPEGSDGKPWQIAAAGSTVVAWTNGLGRLVIEGDGAMCDFDSAASVPWHGLESGIGAVTIGAGVTTVGKNALASLAKDGVSVVAPLALSKQVGEAAGLEPSGAISGAEIEQVQIVDGKAYLGVSVYTNSEVKAQGEGDGWGVATNGVIEVPVPGKQGFFYLMSKPAAPSDRGGAIVTGPTFTPGK